MRKTTKIGGLFVVVASVLVACSTEKNTWVNRNYHSVTAHYNGYYNANELIDQSVLTYRTSRIEDYYEILPLDPVPDETEVIGMYPSIDTAIAKCTKVIRNHSMPSNDRPARKKEEHNRWIDENWTTIGIANYYRRDYDDAMKSFRYVRKFYSNDPSLFVGELWMAKTNIAQGNLTEAKFNLDNLDKAIEDEEARKEEKTKKSKFSKKEEGDEIAKFPKKIRFDLEKTKAELALIKGDKEAAIAYLETSLEHARFHDDKPRVHFVLGQLYQEKGDSEQARVHYTRVIKSRAKFEMAFNAKLKRAFLGSGDKVKKELDKMLKDPKNAEYKDQIYYALAEINFKEGKDTAAIDNLHKSAFYSTKNTRQKGMAYERLGDYSFSKREYVSAQKYYDSCAQVITDTYPNAEGIRGKAQNLAKLVVAIETAAYEDSMQRIAAMDDDAREAFLKDVIKKTKEEEEARKKRDAERLRELQENQDLFADGGSGGKWYWNNSKARQEGFDDFKRLWGQRENEDDWRRSMKIPEAAFDPNNPTEPGNDSIVAGKDEDTLTVDHLMSFVPLTDSAMMRSNERLMQAYFNAGVIYNDQLGEPKLAREQFEAALAKDLQSDPHDLLSAYQLYKLTETSDAVEAAKQRDYILNNYPNSDYANFLRDPEFFIKKKERDALAVQEYVTVLERYERRLFYPVITKADQVIDEEKDNIYRAKYMLLKAMCLGELEQDKTKLLPVLEQLVTEYPESPEAVRGREMIGIIKNGYSENSPVNFESDSPYQFDERAKMRVFVILPENISSTAGKTRVSDFNREFFRNIVLKVDSKILGKSQGVILVEEFDDEIMANDYIRAFKNTKRGLLDLSEAKIYMISKENMKVLFTRMNLEEFEAFYTEYY